MPSDAQMAVFLDSLSCSVCIFSDQQKEAIDKAYEALRSVTVSVSDIQDIYLSDIRKVDTAFWSMYHAFNKEGKE